MADSSTTGNLKRSDFNIDKSDNATTYCKWLHIETISPCKSAYLRPFEAIPYKVPGIINSFFLAAPFNASLVYVKR
jgi:hypothetical protein